MLLDTFKESIERPLPRSQIIAFRLCRHNHQQRICLLWQRRTINGADDTSLNLDGNGLEQLIGDGLQPVRKLVGKL